MSYIGRGIFRFFTGSLFLGLGLGLTAVVAYDIYKLFTDENKSKAPYPQYMDKNNP